jgi:hypothetical protein
MAGLVIETSTPGSTAPLLSIAAGDDARQRLARHRRRGEQHKEWDQQNAQTDSLHRGLPVKQSNAP